MERIKGKIKYEYVIAIVVPIFIISLLIFVLNRKDDNYQTRNLKVSDYSIIKVETVHNLKASIDVRLKREFTKSEIEKLAYELKENQEEEYDRIFICYYLNEMKVGSGAWATSHFDPELEIVMSSPYFDDKEKNINVSLSKTEIAVNEFIAKNSSVEVVGKWYQDNYNLLFFYKKNNKYYLKEMNINTRKIGKGWELIHKNKAFIIKEFLNGTNVDSDVQLIGEYTDYYKIESNGDLTLYDEIGIIERYYKID